MSAADEKEEERGRSAGRKGRKLNCCVTFHESHVHIINASDPKQITVIHQPSWRIFQLFDNLVLLADGRVVYDGSVSEVKDYFS